MNVSYSGEMKLAEEDMFKFTYESGFSVLLKRRNPQPQDYAIALKRAEKVLAAYEITDSQQIVRTLQEINCALEQENIPLVAELGLYPACTRRNAFELFGGLGMLSGSPSQLIEEQEEN